MLFSLCGLRVGWSAVIGIIPVIGDIINIYMAMQLIRLAQKIDGGLPVAQQSKMMTNILIDFGLGLIPVLGIITGALYRANSRNALILQHYMNRRARKNVEQGLFLKDPNAKKIGTNWFSFGRNKNTTPPTAGTPPTSPPVTASNPDPVTIV